MKRPSADLPLGRGSVRALRVVLHLSPEQLAYADQAVERIQAGPRGRAAALRELLLSGAELVLRGEPSAIPKEPTP